MGSHGAPLTERRVAFTVRQAVLHPQPWKRWGGLGARADRRSVSAFLHLLCPPTLRAKSRSPVFPASSSSPCSAPPAWVTFPICCCALCEGFLCPLSPGAMHSHVHGCPVCVTCLAKMLGDLMNARNLLLYRGPSMSTLSYDPIQPIPPLHSVAEEMGAQPFK